MNDQDSFGTNISDLYDGDGSLTFVGDCGFKPTLESGTTFEEALAVWQAGDAFSLGRGEYVTAPNAVSEAEIRAFLRAIDAPEVASASGTIVKLTVSYTPSEDLLLYATYSEGTVRDCLTARRAQGPNGYEVPLSWRRRCHQLRNGEGRRLAVFASSRQRLYAEINDCRRRFSSEHRESVFQITLLTRK